MGGIEPARSSIVKAIELGKPVVTANKELLSTLGAELFKAADDKGVDLFFEAAVAGGIPLVRPLKESLAGEGIKRIIGIVNGTTNFILTRMTEGGVSFAEALAEAESLGYAEEDPTADIEGFDAAAKAAILASIAFRSRVVAGDVYREGISHVTHRDIEFAQRLGYTVKLVAIAEELDGEIAVRVHPAMLPERASAGFGPRLVQRGFRRGCDGRGAHVLRTRRRLRIPTGSAVVGDIVAAARNLVHGRTRARLHLLLRQARPPDRRDGVAVLLVAVGAGPARCAGAGAAAFGSHGISIRSVWQEGYGDEAQLVMVTHRGKEANLQATVDELGKLEVVTKVVSVLRVEGEEE